MKTNAIIRIVIYSLVILILVAILCAGLGIGTLSFQVGSLSGDYKTGAGSAPANTVTDLEIEWAAGSVRIETADVDWISFQESGSTGEKDAMAYAIKGSTLHISYGKSPIKIGLVSTPEKDLTITVPRDWVCKALELDGAALDVEIYNLNVGTFDIDGASNKIDFYGAFTSLSCDGAACELNMICTDRPREIDLDGAACQLDVVLPKDCGFSVQIDGLSCDFQSDFDYVRSEDRYVSGDCYCSIDADGISCDVKVRKGE